MSTLIPALFTFGFWLFAGRLAGPEAIGLVSAIASFVMIMVTIDVLDTSLGMKRQLGMAYSAKDMGRFKQILFSTTLFVLVTVMASAVLLAIPNLQLLEIANIDRQYIWIIVAMLPALAFQYVFSEALIAAMRSDKLIIPLLIGSLCRFPLLFAAIYILYDSSYAVLVAYASFLFISTAFYSVYVMKIFRTTRVSAFTNMSSNTKQILMAGLVSWIPHIISVLGSQLAILTVFAVQGSEEGGKFYLAMAIFTVSLFIIVGINKVSHPLLAGMNVKEQQAKFLTYSMKIAFMLTMPITIPLLFFADNFISLMGTEFSSAGVTLAIFMVGVPFAIISEMVYYFVYGKGDNKAVLSLGLAANVPRVILYFYMVPILGSNGAALAYLVGSAAALISSIRIMKTHSLVIDYRSFSISIVVPLALGVLTWLADIPYIFSTIIIILGSLIIYIKLGLFTDAELQYVLYSGLPKGQAQKIYPTLSKVIDWID
jgi:O-antigen/teichoic acid export membrane protein